MPGPADGVLAQTPGVMESEESGRDPQRRSRVTPNPASVEAQTPDVGPERGSAVMGGGRR